MTTTETPHGFTISAIPDERQDGPNLPSVAEAITNKRSRAQASRAAQHAMPAAGGDLSIRRLAKGITTEAEMEFMRAMQLYKQASGRMFPTWSEVLEVLKGLGYEKVGPDSV